MKTSFFLIAECTLLCMACNPQTKKSDVENVQADTITAFYYPSIPTLLTDPADRASYLVKHYWDNINFADTNYILRPEVTEQAWANFIDILKLVSPAEANEALEGVIQKTGVQKKSLLYIAGLADKYLYDPNSPFRNEEYYITVLKAFLASPLLNETEKIRPNARYKMALRNRVGTKATDFVFTLASGRKGHLYDIQSEFTVLFINNPGCEACTEMINSLRESPIVTKLYETGHLKVLSLYPDEDIEYWRKHLADFPEKWLNAYDEGMVITRKALYDLKAVPTLYLLNKSKMVVLKDTTPQAIEHYLLNNFAQS